MKPSPPPGRVEAHRDSSLQVQRRGETMTKSSSDIPDQPVDLWLLLVGLAAVVLFLAGGP